MRISVFLSYPKPCFSAQAKFIKKLTDYLDGRGFAPRTLGVTDYDMDAPLKAIRRLMLESNGLITIAFRRSFIGKGKSRHGTDIAGASEEVLDGQWLTSPWSQIEPAMAYQLGLPILIYREAGVLAEGILERGVVGLYMPKFDTRTSPDNYFKSVEWGDIMGRWEGYVRSVVERKVNPALLF